MAALVDCPLRHVARLFPRQGMGAQQMRQPSETRKWFSLSCAAPLALSDEDWETSREDGDSCLIRSAAARNLFISFFAWRAQAKMQRLSL